MLAMIRLTPRIYKQFVYTMMSLESELCPCLHTGLIAAACDASHCSHCLQQNRILTAGAGQGAATSLN